MIKIKDANNNQKAMVKNFLKNMLKMARCHDNYRIEQDSQDLMIRESTHNPPSASHKQRLLFLIKNPLMKVRLGYIEIRTHLGGSLNIPTFYVTEINDTLINALIAQLTKATVKKPDDVDDLIWSQIPQEITNRWDRFSRPLQKHIVECVNTNLQKILAQVPDQKQADIGATYMSPVGLSAPSIPVRLPSPKKSADEETPRASGPAIEFKIGPTAETKIDVKAEVNKVYDLLEILAIRKRDPKDETRRCHPLTREYFSLNEVLPASDALVELKKRAEKILEKNEFEPAPQASGGAPRSR